MPPLLQKLDDLAAVGDEKGFARMLGRIAFVFLILMFVFAPHSIAATQIAWLTGMFAWFVRLFTKPRPRLVRTPLDLSLWIFFAWSVITSIFSYDPPTSLDKLRNVALFLIFYFIVNAVKTRRAAVFLASTLILSSMVSVLWTPIERIFGRGVEISNVGTNSILSKTALQNGDTILKANDRKVSTPEELLTEIERGDVTPIYFYRPDYYLTIEVKRADLLDGGNALEKLGIGSWKPSRNWRSMGFLSHYATFAEVLQLIISLTFGLLIASFGSRKKQFDASGAKENYFRKSAFSPLLLFCVAAMGIALLLTVTRASQIGFLCSAFAIVFVGANRKMLLILAAVALPVALLGVYFQQQSRNVGFFDAKDASTRDRETFYRKGFDLWTKNARNFSVGVGMDSTKKFIKEWNLYDNEGAPMGHFHSTPLQLLVERGFPALFLWLWVLWVYGRTLLRWLKKQRSADSIENSESPPIEWREKGIVLGAFGGLVGFFSAGFVHYNLGTAMVAMVFFMMMGLSFVIIAPHTNDSETLNG
ncbi:MAG: O-antigen ligase family protein [Acidobacteriota bacterium]|nr:O-antigen ligase family protein [Acidobacteriota bacterium]